MSTPYSSPAKRQVRAMYFAGLERMLPLLGSAPVNGVYLPGVHNWEGPGYARLGLKPFAVERNARRYARIVDPAQSAHPLKEVDLFQGSLLAFMEEQALAGGPRLSFANCDFEGRVHAIADELMATFSLFPGPDAGYMAITTFAARDDRTIIDGVLHLNYLNAALAGEAFEDLGAVTDQWAAYVRAHGRQSRYFNQVARDFGLLWRLVLGMGLVEMPTEGPGALISGRHRAVAEACRIMYMRASEIRSFGSQPFLYRIEDPGLGVRFSRYTVSIIPLTLQRIVYRSVAGRNRMCTWLIGFHRTAPVLWSNAVASLWHMYCMSTLLYVDDLGEIHPFPPTWR